jgi:hypothetical protein
VDNTATGQADFIRHSVKPTADFKPKAAASQADHTVLLKLRQGDEYKLVSSVFFFCFRTTESTRVIDWANFGLLGHSFLGCRFFSKYKSSPNYGYFFPGENYTFIFTKKWIGLHFGRFFTNSSGHRARYGLVVKSPPAELWVVRSNPAQVCTCVVIVFRRKNISPLSFSFKKKMSKRSLNFSQVLNMQQYSPENITVKLNGNELTVTASLGGAVSNTDDFKQVPIFELFSGNKVFKQAPILEISFSAG